METTVPLASRMEQRRNELGLTLRATVARMTTTEPSTGAYHHWEAGKRKPPLDLVPEIARALEVSPAWLCGFSDEPQGTGGRNVYAHLPDAAITLPDGSATAIKPDRSLLLADSLIANHKWRASQLILVPATDASMAGVIGLGDLVLIDREQVEPRDLDIYAMLVNGRIWFRWVRPELDKSFTVMAEDSGKIPETRIEADQMETLCILGRVVAITHFR